MTKRPLPLLAAFVALPLALAPAAAPAAEGDHDGRWRLEYACTQNSANGAAAFRARIELQVQGGVLSARTASRNNRLNRDDVEQWSGGFSGASISMRTAGSASDGASWEYEWSGTASAPAEGSVTGALFASVRGARTQVRGCEGTLVLVAPAPSSLAARAASRQQEANAAAARQKEAEDAAARQRAVDEAAARQREADAAAARQKEAEDAARAARGTTPARSPSPDGRASPQATLEAFLEAHAGHRGLDLVLLADVGQPRGAFQRAVGGGLVLVQKTFCVEAPLLYAEPERAPIPLRALGEAVGGLPEVVGTRTAYGALARAPARLVASGFRDDAGDRRLAPEWALRFSSIASTIAAATREKFGAGAVESVTIGPNCSQSVASAQLVPRVFLQSDIEELLAPAADPQRRAARAPTLRQRFPQVADQLARIARGEFAEVASIDVASMRAVVARRSEAEDQKRQKQDDFLDELANSAPAGAGARFGAIVLGTDASRAATNHALRPCAVKPANDEFPEDVADLALVLRGDGIRDAVPGRAEPLRAFASIDELFVHLKRGDRWCSVVVGNGRALAALHGAMERDRVAHTMVWHAITLAQLGEIKAGTLGYRAMEGRTALQAWIFAGQVGNATPQVIQVLAELGIMAKPGYDEAMARLAAARGGDAADVQGLVGFLQDERAAQARGLTVGQLRAERREEARRAEAAAEAARANREAEAQGFRAVEGRGAAEAMAFAREIGGATPRQVEALRMLGVETKAGHDEAMARLKASGLRDGEDADALVGFLRDEREARQRGISIARLRTEREAAERRAAAEAEAARREQEKRRAVEFPFVAEFTCSVAQQRTSLQACLYSGSIQTEVEIRNGGDHRVFKIHDVAQMGAWNGSALVVDLRRSFEIKAQNADETFVLGLVVRDRASGAVRYQREAGRFGALRVGN
ncbi:MAG: hypothetical protein FJX21_00845 [Alphaproteobacteria bacterium]|nr:hypothetical protein [Alphaproteobacteria bacterium]